MIFHSGVLSSNIGRSISNERGAATNWSGLANHGQEATSLSITRNGRNLGHMGFRSTGRAGPLHTISKKNGGNFSAELKHILANNHTKRKINNVINYNTTVNSPTAQNQYTGGIGSKER